MKKSDVDNAFKKRRCKKLNFKMKFCFLVASIMLFQLSANSVMSQKKMEFDYSNVPLKRILNEIKSQTGYRFFYNVKEIDDTQKTSLNVDKETIREVLRKLSVKVNFDYRINGNQVVLTQKGSTIHTSQKTEIKGTVMDRDGTPLPGASIVEKGTTNGTQSDFDGNFSIEVANSNATLVVSYIGFASKEIPVNGQSNLNVTLEESAAGLDEVVVVGYGTQVKKDITGSVSSISIDDLEALPVANAQQFIQGRAAGVQVQQTSGDLNGRFNITVRGLNSTGANGPLYVVDGVPLATESFSTINPSEIASIDILKDASATAIYGARASNGVVVITTKTGKPGKAKFNLEVKSGLENATKTFDMMDTGQLLAHSEKAYINLGQNWPGISDELAANDNDWQDLILRPGSWQEYALSVTGGNEKTKFSISGSYLDRKGILIGTSLHRASARVNIDSEITDRLKVGLRVSNSSQWGEETSNDQTFGRGFRAALFLRPWNPYKDENGQFAGIPSRSAPNNGPQENFIAAILEEVNETKINRLLGNAFIEYKITNGLNLKYNFGADLLSQNGYTYFPIYDRGGYRREEGVVTQSNSNNLNLVSDLTLTYNKIFDKHKITGLLGFSAQSFHVENFGVTAQGTTNNILNQLSNQTDIINATGGETENGLVSYFARLNYDYDGKYLLTGTVRRDGSSRFGPNNKYGIFPSGSVAWRLSEENFMENVGTINDLKIRGSYGLTGNQNIGNFRYLATTTLDNYVFGDTEVTGIRPNSFANQDIQWESNRQWDIGMDLSMFNNRLSFQADYYDKKSNDLLVVVPKPSSTGISGNPTVNLGSINNKGFEFGFVSRNLVNNFKWTTTFNIATNKNEVLDIGIDASDEPAQIPGSAVDGFLGGIGINLTTQGQPIGAFYTHVWDGIWQMDEADEAAVYNREPGDSKYIDLDDDGDIDLNDRKFVGQAAPKYFGGMDNTFSYKGFTMSLFVNWQQGNKLFNQVRQFIESGHAAVNQLDVDFWTPENQSTIYPRPLNSGRSFGENSMPSTRFLEDASFVRIKNLSIAYDIPNLVCERIGIQSLKLGINVTNLATFTKYSGLDPESSSLGVLSSGSDYTPYPLARTYMLSLNLGL
jgi:TonB-linked SusC/RagA family outer membrane protein